jgi:hypothetical protein
MMLSHKDCIETGTRVSSRRRSGFQPCEEQKLLHQAAELAGFTLQPRQFRAVFFSELPPQQSERRMHARERRAQFVGNVSNEPALRGDPQLNLRSPDIRNRAPDL